MTKVLDIVDGWQVREAPNGGYLVCDDHGVVDGPFPSRAAAAAAAHQLPNRTLANWRLPSTTWKPAE